jgi:hypothetical protein
LDSIAGKSEGNEELPPRIACEMSAQAYDVDPPLVLRMVRAVGAAATSCQNAVMKKEICQAADHLLQSLIGRVQDSELSLLTEVLETMSFASVGTQVFLDMILAIILSHHRRDIQALSPNVSMEIGSLLGQLASGSLRLRPRGLGGPSAVTNRRVMDIIEKRIVEGINSFKAEELARIDSYFLTRICGEDVQKVIVTKIAELQLGLTADTQQYLPLVLNLQESIHRELSDPFRWALPRHVRMYLEHLRRVGLESEAPWALGTLQLSEMKVNKSPSPSRVQEPQTFSNLSARMEQLRASPLLKIS